MGVHKGTDNFAGYRNGKCEESKNSLISVLNILRKKKRKYFTNMATLVFEVSLRTGLHRTTLTRNPLYYNLLNNFLHGQPGAAGKLDRKAMAQKALEGKLIDSELEIGRLQRQFDACVAPRKSTTVVSIATALFDESAAHVYFSDTVWTLRAVLERINSDATMFEVDLEKSEIRDLSAAPGRRIVASGKRAKPFIDAYRLLLEQEKN